jgi:heme exporter protein B
MTTQRWIAVLNKDLRSEVRTRYGITTLALFVVTVVSLLAYATAEEPLAKPIIAGVIWILMFFTAMSGLGRGFMSEEERGTALYLRLSAPTSSVYWGKLAGNLVFSLLSNLALILLFLILMPLVQVGSFGLLLLTVVLGSCGLATIVTITSAIVAKAGSRNSLLPVLSFPLLLPLVMPGIQATLYALAGLGIAEAWGDISVMIAHTGIVAVVSWLVFGVLWEE